MGLRVSIKDVDIKFKLNDPVFMLFFTVYYRFVVLFFNCLLTFGSYFCFDIPSVLQDQFQGVSKRWRGLSSSKIQYRSVSNDFSTLAQHDHRSLVSELQSLSSVCGRLDKNLNHQLLLI